MIKKKIEGHSKFTFHSYYGCTQFSKTGKEVGEGESNPVSLSSNEPGPHCHLVLLCKMTYPFMTS